MELHPSRPQPAYSPSSPTTSPIWGSWPDDQNFRTRLLAREAPEGLLRCRACDGALASSQVARSRGRGVIAVATSGEMKSRAETRVAQALLPRFAGRRPGGQGAPARPGCAGKERNWLTGSWLMAHRSAGRRNWVSPVPWKPEGVCSRRRRRASVKAARGRPGPPASDLPPQHGRRGLPVPRPVLILARLPSEAHAGRGVVSPQNRDVQHRIGKCDVQPRLLRELPLVAASVPLALNEVLLLDRQKSPRCRA